MRAALALLLLIGPVALAQPTYRLDVRGDLKPLATLSVNGERIRRSAVKDDPGFRLQFHFQKEGKTIATIDARADEAVVPPSLEPGVYTVALELFHPGYKGGTGIKGQFKAVSETLTYRIEPGKPVKIAVVPPAKKP